MTFKGGGTRSTLFLDLLYEISNKAYDYGCVMVYFDFPELKDIQSNIKENDLREDFGLEDEPHVTLLYGLHEEVTLADVKKEIDNITFGPLTLYNVSLFENEDFDVLEFDVKGKGIRAANKRLQNLPFTSNYIDYNPHCTVAYLKPGKGKQYVEMFKDQTYEIVPKEGMYSSGGEDGKKQTFQIQIEKE